MEEEDVVTTNRIPFLGMLSAPLVIAVMLLTTIGLTWKVIDYDVSHWNTILLATGVMLVAAVLGKVPGLIPSDSIPLSPASKSALFAAIIAAISYAMLYYDMSLLALAFGIIAVGVHVLDKAGWHEEENILVAVVAGFIFAIQVAAAGHEWIPEDSFAGQAYNLIDIERTTTVFLFFGAWTAMIIDGAILALLFRGRLSEPGKGPWFRNLDNVAGNNFLPLYIALGIWWCAHIAALVQLQGLENPDAMFLGVHLTYIGAFSTGLVLLFVAFCWAERWRTLGAVVLLNYLLFCVGSWQSKDMFGLGDVDFLTGDMGNLTWFLLFFWLNAGIIYLGFVNKLGDAGGRREHGGARQWWSANWYGITVGGALLVALAIRTLWNVLPALNGTGPGEWDMTGGSDPWYMKRAIDYIIAHNSHFVIDMDRSYPLGSINPRPPLFTWTLALAGKLLNPFVAGDVNEAAWWGTTAMPAIYGALTVLPIAAMAHKQFGKGAGATAAWLMALMPGHVGHSTFALADHDAFVMLFTSLGVYFWMIAVGAAGSDKLLEDAHWHPRHLARGISAAFQYRSKAMAYSILAGVSFATVALGWKGFVYILAIIFVAYFLQTSVNMLRRRDNMPVTAAMIVMVGTAFLLPLPFYANPELSLLLDASGFQPMFYILFAVLANGWVVTAYRDKPWLMVIVTGLSLLSVVLLVLWMLQNVFNVYNGWDVLFTGGYYFTKNKIFGTIAEAQAPSRGMLFGSFGPIVMLLALGAGIGALWSGIRHRNHVHLFLSIWTLLGIYMAWSAGRFVFNATPVMAVMGAWASVYIWRLAGSREFVKTWRRSGISTSGARFKSTYRASKKHPAVPAVLLVFILMFSQHAIYGIDSGIPRGDTNEKRIDQTFFDLAPDVMRADLFGWSLMPNDRGGNSYSGYGVGDEEVTSCRGTCWYMGTFGPGFNGRSWNDAYDWLEHQDADEDFSERPAFVSWWDYGFQALTQGQHPTVADNFQSGIPAAGNMLLSNSEQDTLGLFIGTLDEGDRRYKLNNDPDGYETSQHTNAFENAMRSHFQYSTTYDIWIDVTTAGDIDIVKERSFRVTASADDVILAEGHPVNEDGSVATSVTLYRLYEDYVLLDEFTSESEMIQAWDVNSKTDWGEDGIGTTTSHYIIGDYWYTKDMVEDFNDVGTSLHRQNARLAMARELLINTMSMDDMVALFHDLTSIDYEVVNYDAPPGETIVRNHDIRYFAVDNRLYPIGGYQYAESSFHYGNPTGIFYAPTTLAGLDPNNYLETVYITQRGDRPEQEMTSAEYEEAYIADILASQSGSGADIITLTDVRVDQQEAFFDTMIARTYVGYGGPHLGLQGRLAQPAQHFGGRGTPETALAYAPPLPGAMMQHFVLANWYDPTALENELSVGSANTGVKILKYYSGATLEGDVVLGDLGVVPNAKILIERDAFSGEEVEAEDGTVTDRDPRTYWIPIGATQADDEGHYSFRAPAGKIRVSAFMGLSDLDSARVDLISSGTSGSASWVTDILQDGNDDREINPITGILANVSGATWLGESVINISAVDGHSDGEAVLSSDVTVEASGATGRITWEGHESFNGDPIANLEVDIINIWGETVQPPYTITTSTGLIEGDREFRGTGEVTFTGPGFVESDGVVTATDFTGTYTRDILHEHSFTGSGDITGRGTLVGTLDENATAVADTCDNGTVPGGFDACYDDNEQHWIIDGTAIGAAGRFTANGTSQFLSVMNRQTFVGAGVFTIDASNESLETYGTINGTGLFSGTGIYSGPMVEPGTFHLVDAIPGVYHVRINFPNGETRQLPMPLEIGLEHLTDIELWLPGSYVHGVAETVDGDFVQSTFELLEEDDRDAEPTGLCEDVLWAPCLIESDENGSFGFGPLTEGDFILTLDMDDDGFNEYESTQIRIMGDSAQNVSASNVNHIVTMHDLNISLYKRVGDDVEIVEGQNLTFTTPLMPIEIVARDNGNGSYNVELPMGEWIVNSSLDENYLIYEELVIEDEDIDLDLYYQQSAWLNGTVVHESEKEGDPPVGYDNLAVRFQWGGITTVEYTETFTADNGTEIDGFFSIRLPVGVGVNITTETGISHDIAGVHIDVLEDNPMLNLVPEEAYNIAGHLFLYRDTNPYTSNIPGWMMNPIFIEATSDNLTWQLFIDNQGKFTGMLPYGNWSITVNDPVFNSETIVQYMFEDNNSVQLIAHPAKIPVVVTTYLDHSLDSNISNGTLLGIDFSIIPTSFGSGERENITADDIRWENGTISLLLEPGTFEFETELPDVSNGTDYNRQIATSETELGLMIGNETWNLEIGLLPEWRISAQLNNESGEGLANWPVRFEESDGVRTFTRNMDENGSLLAYLPEGEWIVIVDPFIQGEGVMEELRSTLSIDAASSGIQWTTTESAHVNITLREIEMNENLSSFTISAVSEDGYGEMILGPTDDTGSIDARIYPGTWTFSMNRTDNNMRWVLENVTVTLAAGWANDNLTLEANRYVTVGGNLFWDLDGDGGWDFDEGIEDATVELVGGNFGPVNMTTTQYGTWTHFVPVHANYSVTAIKEGFSPETVIYEIEAVANSTDMMLLAGSVNVEGNLTYIIPELWDDIAERMEIVLLPYGELDREPLTPDKTLDNGSWTGHWSTAIEPGKWVVYAYDATGHYNVTLGLLDASIGDGGNLDLIVSEGGRLSFGTSWFDFDGVEHHLAETDVPNAPMTTAPELIVDAGSDIKWNVTVDEDGRFDMLLPAGSYSFDSTFWTVERGIDMRYSGGLSSTSAPMQDSPEDSQIEFNRRLDHSLEFNTGNTTNSTYDVENDWHLIEVAGDDVEYKIVEMDIEVTYAGNEAVDEYVFNAVLNGFEAEYWTIEAYNGTDANGTEEWLTNVVFTLGLEDDLFETMRVRIIPANMTTARTYDSGHSMIVELSHMDGSSSEHHITLKVPQFYGFELETDLTDYVIGIQPGTEEIIPLMFSNTGNGDDTYTVSIDDSEMPEDWAAAGADIIPIGAASIQSFSMSLHAPSNTEDVSFSLWITVTSEGGDEYPVIEIPVEVALPSLQISDAGVLSGAQKGYAVANEINTFFVTVENTGIVDADIITVYIYSEDGDELASASGPVSKQDSYSFQMDVDTTGLGIGNHHFNFVINSTGLVLQEEPDDYTMTINIQKSDSDGVEWWIGVVVLFIFVLLLYGGWKFTARRPGQPF